MSQVTVNTHTDNTITNDLDLPCRAYHRQPDAKSYSRTCPRVRGHAFQKLSDLRRSESTRPWAGNHQASTHIESFSFSVEQHIYYRISSLFHVGKMSQLPPTESDNRQGDDGAAAGVGEGAHDEHPALSGRRGEDIEGWIADCRPPEFRPSKLSKVEGTRFAVQFDAAVGSVRCRQQAQCLHIVFASIFRPTFLTQPGTPANSHPIFNTSPFLPSALPISNSVSLEDEQWECAQTLDPAQRKVIKEKYRRRRKGQL